MYTYTYNRFPVWTPPSQLLHVYYLARLSSHCTGFPAAASDQCYCGTPQCAAAARYYTLDQYVAYASSSAIRPEVPAPAADTPLLP